MLFEALASYSLMFVSLFPFPPIRDPSRLCWVMEIEHKPKGYLALAKNDHSEIQYKPFFTYGRINLFKVRHVWT